MSKTVKIIIFAGILLAALSAVYYFFFYTPKTSGANGGAGVSGPNICGAGQRTIYFPDGTKKCCSLTAEQAGCPPPPTGAGGGKG